MSIPLVFVKAYRREQYLSRLARREVAREKRWLDLWTTKSWPALLGLCELQIVGAIPWRAPWEFDSIKRWPEKRYFQRLVRAGIIPLFIQDGGIGTRQEKPLFLSDDLPLIQELPEYVQSKRRACFEFILPFREGYKKQPYPQYDRPRKAFTNALVNNQHGYRVCISAWHPKYGGPITIESNPAPDGNVPLEIGAKSHFEFLLHFKKDTVLREAKGETHLDDWSQYMKADSCPLLQIRDVDIVRVESPNYGRRRLDEWVYGIAQESGLSEIWTEQELKTTALQWIRRNGLELPGLDQ
ncbi:hypothetical protein BU26DRAFT_438788 [Trematosphaeria pertusa]|uniref:Uncharacterized protein n=1 Tax=Trematosphaeria pertusa TaxID=390896 RepID=A0A6A6HVZ5_9PLEO|nr:uncharacterized protein BU26DRAFT_438788 [Trematosphaeria pertusa]KAF2242227.1 hypothetical protein BU26DRAFT_438788 [Trematosphaeria pertusa]